MNQDAGRQRRLSSYIKLLSHELGHIDRAQPFEEYMQGLLLPGSRKSVEPIAARIAPREVSAKHQSLHHFVAEAGWSERRLMMTARDYALPLMKKQGGIEAWVIDDTGFPKKGSCSVGVSRQYCGIRGKQDNCQVAVSLSIVNTVASIPVAWRLYLPETWVTDPIRRKIAKVPKEIDFQTKWSMALAQIDEQISDGVEAGPIVSDAGYGQITAFRNGLCDRKLTYVLAVTGETSVRPPGSQPRPPKSYSGRGRHPSRWTYKKNQAPISIHDLAISLSPSAWKIVEWREGTKGIMKSRFASVRARSAHRDVDRSGIRDEEWIIIEWPTESKSPTKYYMSNLPGDTSIERLVHLGKLRWRIERDYQELKDELGLDHFEGRSWRGFHHHCTLCIAAYLFVASERLRLFPPERAAFLYKSPMSASYKPRGSPLGRRTA
jgi:SRSO17 transposase